MAKKKRKNEFVPRVQEQAEPISPPELLVPPEKGKNWLVFVVGLVLSLGFLTTKTWWEAEHIHKVTEMRILDGNKREMGTPTHSIIVPTSFIDSYAWLHNAQTMVREGAWRIRFIDLDNAPKGRKEPWNNGFVWFLVFLGWLYGQANHMGTEQGIEFAAIYASPLILYIQMVVLGILVTRRYNGWLGAVFVASMVATSSGCEPFSTGYIDHHGEALTAAVGMGLFALMAGAGWVSEIEGAGGNFALWIPRRQARRWMIASAVMGGAGMWISSFAQTALIGAVGAGVFLAILIFGRRQADGAGKGEVQFDPSLWRLWGIAGGLSCLFFYLLEHFPNDMEIRLEDNHPIFGLAWWGGAEILYRIARWRIQGKKPHTTGDWAMVSTAIFGVLLPVILAKWGSTDWFVFRDDFAWRHHHTLYEFQPFLTSSLAMIPWYEHLRMWGLLPLAIIPGLLFLFWQRLSLAVRGWLVIGLVQAVVMTGLFLNQIRWGIVLIGPLQVLVLCLFVLVLYGLRGTRPWLSKALASGYLLATLGVYPGMTLYSMWRDKHSPAAEFPTMIVLMVSLFFVLMVLLAARYWLRQRRTWAMDALGMGLLVATFGVFLGTTAYSMAYDPLAVQVNFARGDVATVVMRDIAGKLRMISPPNERPVVLSCPNSSLPLAYFGDLRTVGTNYWRNMDGLKDNAAIYSAQSDEEARKLLRDRQVRYIVLFSETNYIDGYFNIYTNGDPRYKLEKAFAFRLANPNNRPYWLRFIPYPMPAEFQQLGFAVCIYEVQQD